MRHVGAGPVGTGGVERGEAVRVEDLHKTYPGGVEAVRGLWFEVREGEIFGLLGPNGAGKSTALGVLTTVVRATRGHVRVAGCDVRRDAIALRRSIGLVFQESVLDNEFSGRENLRPRRLWRVPRPDTARRIDELLSVMGLGSGPTTTCARTAVGCGGGSRSPGRCWPDRESSSSTSRPPGSTPPSGTPSGG